MHINNLPQPYHIAPYYVNFAHALVAMWRASFERAVGVTDPHSMQEQVDYLHGVVVPNNRVTLVLDDGNQVVAFLASNDAEINQLYVHIDHQGKGIGTALLHKAMSESAGRLTLYTFAANTTAQRFYEKHGFKVIERGFEEEWQLEDVKYRWEDVGIKD